VTGVSGAGVDIKAAFLAVARAAPRLIDRADLVAVLDRAAARKATADRTR